MDNKAWYEIQPDLIQKSFKKCSISNNLYGTEDYLFMDQNNSDNKNRAQRKSQAQKQWKKGLKVLKK